MLSRLSIPLVAACLTACVGGASPAEPACEGPACDPPDPCADGACDPPPVDPCADGACDPPPEDPCEGVVCVDALPAVLEGRRVEGRRDGYGCAAALDASGPEVVHRVVLEEEAFLSATVTGDVGLVALLAGPDPACVDAHPSAVGALLPPGEHHVVVDGAAAVDGAFTLRIAATTPATFVAAGVDEAMAADALTIYANAWAWGATRRTEYAVIDFTRHSAEPRQWVFDMATHELLWHLRVAHGRRSTDGVDLAHAVTFSNVPESNQSSLGLLRAAGTYVGTFGPSHRLEGLEPGFNDNVCARDIVMHPWSPMGDEYVDRCGWARPSLGCPAIDDTLSRPVRDRLARPDGAELADGVLMLFWYPGTEWQASSRYLSGVPDDALLAQLAVECDSSTDGTPTPPASTDYRCD